jgi:hypothetical protein
VLGVASARCVCFVIILTLFAVVPLGAKDTDCVDAKLFDARLMWLTTFEIEQCRSAT